MTQVSNESYCVIDVSSLSVTDPESELVAPAIVIGPKDTTVVAGSEATLECIANARYRSVTSTQKPSVLLLDTVFFQGN